MQDFKIQLFERENPDEKLLFNEVQGEEAVTVIKRLKSIVDDDSFKDRLHGRGRVRYVMAPQRRHPLKSSIVSCLADDTLKNLS